MCIGLISCEDNYKHITSNIDGIVYINDKKCEIIVIKNLEGGYLYYVDCPTGSSATSYSGKNYTTTVVNSKPETIQTSETISCPMPSSKPCNCQ